MSRYDKYDPVSGGYRAPLAGAYTVSSTLIGVGHDVNGRVVPGGGNTGITGVMVVTGPWPANAVNRPTTLPAGTVVDIMTDGEVLETPFAAGRVITADTTTGALGTTAPDATHIRVGHTVEAGRLIVRVRR